MYKVPKSSLVLRRIRNINCKKFYFLPNNGLHLSLVFFCNAKQRAGKRMFDIDYCIWSEYRNHYYEHWCIRKEFCGMQWCVVIQQSCPEFLTKLTKDFSSIIKSSIASLLILFSCRIEFAGSPKGSKLERLLSGCKGRSTTRYTNTDGQTSTDYMLHRPQPCILPSHSSFGH